MKTLFAAFAIAASLAMTAPASATVLQLNATTTDALIVSSFSLTFDDVDMDSLLSLSEIVTFSGVTCTICGGAPSYDTVTTAPLIAGFADGSGTKWFFSGASGPFSGDVPLWTYELLGGTQPPEVPLPAAAPLFLAGLAGLGLSRRRRKSAS